MKKKKIAIDSENLKYVDLRFGKKGGRVVHAKRKLKKSDFIM